MGRAISAPSDRINVATGTNRQLSMCGIAGILNFRRSFGHIDPRWLSGMRDRMAHRGPDGAGLWISPDHSVGLGHRRLAILDLSESGAQPMREAQVCVSYNGEIYNHVELRAQLEGLGYTFR